jgi:hypothetical protein
LWDLKLAVQFPPGSCILIPSAVVAHSNVPVSPHETRLSFTQYCAGAIFRWIHNGGRTDKELRSQDPALFAELEEMKNDRWEAGLALYSSLNELIEYDDDRTA